MILKFTFLFGKKNHSKNFLTIIIFLYIKLSFNIYIYKKKKLTLEKAECRSKESRPDLLVGSKKDLLSSSNCCLISCRSSSPDLPRNLSLNFGLSRK